MNASGNFGIKKQKLIQSGNIPLNYVDNEREVIISFTAVGDNTPLYKFYNYNNQAGKTFTLNSANVHPTNDFLAASDIDNGYYNEEEGYLLSLVRIYWELTPFSASYTTQSYLNGFVKIDVNYNDFASSTYSIVGYYGDNGNPYVGGFTDSNVNIHYYDETNDLVYLTTGDTTLDAKFEIVDAASPSITQTKGTTANGYVHIIDFDEKNLISEVRIAGIDTTDNLYHNYRYNWNTDTLVMSATSGNAPTVYKDGSRYIEIDAIASQATTPTGDGSITVRLQDFDCNDITVLSQEDNILSSTPNRVASSEIIGGRSFDDTTRFMMSDSSGTYIYTSDQKDNNKVLTSTASKVLSSNCTYLKEVEYTTLSVTASEYVVGIDNTDSYLYTVNTNDNSAGALTIRQYVMGATLSFTQSWTPSSKSLIRVNGSFLWDKHKKTFWVSTYTGSNIILNKIKINEAALTASTFLEEVSYPFPGTSAFNTTKVAYLKEEANDIIISLSTTANDLNNVYYVEKDTGSTSKTVDMTYIADSFQIRENLYLSDFNVSYFNTLGYGLTGIPSLNIKYDYNTDTAEVLYSNIDRDNYTFETYLSKKLQRVIYKDPTDDYLKYSVFDFKNDNEYSIIRSGATVSSSLSHIMKRDGHIASFDASNGVYQEFMIDNKVFETGSDPCGDTELDVSTFSPMILEIQTDGSNQFGINTSQGLGLSSQTFSWGDGTSDTYSATSTKIHTYRDSGVYEIRIYGGAINVSLLGTGFETNLLAIKQWGDLDLRSGFSFQGCSNLIAKYSDRPNFSNATNLSLQNSLASCPKFNGKLDHWDMSNVLTLTAFIANNVAFNQPLNSWDVSNVQFMNSLFFNCPNFNQPLNDWDTSSVINTSVMFSGCTNFNQPLDNWDTSNVTNMSQMFNGCRNFNQPIGNWDTGSVSNTNAMFNNCEKFNQPLNNWDMSSVENMTNMFIRCDVFNQPLDNWDVSNVEFATQVFYECFAFNQPLNSWNTSSMRFTTSMFFRADSFNQDLDQWDMSNVEDMRQMFANADLFNGNVVPWDTSSCIDMDSMFRASSFDQDIDSWTVSNVEDFGFMFFRCPVNYSLNSWDTSSATLMDGVFYECPNFNSTISNWDMSNVTNTTTMFRVTPFNKDVSDWDVSSLENMSQMFIGATQFNQDISGWTVSNVTNMNSAFNNCLSFNQDIGGWDVASVSNFSSTFFNCDAFDQDLNSWDVSSAEDMAAMFWRSGFNGTISNWDVSNVTDMRLMFNSTPFNKDIGDWDVSKVEDMEDMFASAFDFNQDIGGWTTSAVTDMNAMFLNANNFDQDISGWDIDQVNDFGNFYFTSFSGGFTTSNYDAILIGWESQAPTSGITIDFGNSKYTGGGAAAAARASLIGTYSWTISDGGIA